MGTRCAIIQGVLYASQTEEIRSAPALPPYNNAFIFKQLQVLLPVHRTDFSLGCPRRRILDRVVFEKLVQVLVLGCAYERLAEGSYSESTLRRRQDEWIELGVMERLREISLDAYDRFIGPRLAHLAMDCRLTKARWGTEKAGRSPVDRGQGASSAPR